MNAVADSINPTTLPLDGARANAALSASWEIEQLCGVLRQTVVGTDEGLAVRGITARIEDLSRAIMNVLSDNTMATAEIHLDVFLEHMEEEDAQGDEGGAA